MTSSRSIIESRRAGWLVAMMVVRDKSGYAVVNVPDGTLCGVPAR
jgi:hypothetical protein